MIPRSWLFIPGDSLRKLEKADGSGADAVILDLEDAVAPGRKAEARGMVRAFLDARSGSRAGEVWVRVNPLDAGALEDLAAVMPGRPDGIVLPKAGGAADVARLGHWLDAFEVASGLKVGATRVLPVATETPGAVLDLPSYAKQPLPRLVGLTWGAEDLSAALGATGNRGADGDWAFVYRVARAQLLLAAKAAGVAAIETLQADFRDEAGLAASSAAAAAEGFEGRLAIHPAQVAVINAAFAPSEAAVEHARRVVMAFAASPEAGTVGLDGTMLDRPHLRQAEAVLARAGQLGDRG